MGRQAEKGEKRGRARSFAPLTGFVPLVLVLAACSGLPKINGAPLPPEKGDANPVYRDLADIPDPPQITATETNQGTVKALTEDRANTAQAAEDLRRQPFDQPDPATHSGF
ncbi:MAG TPA: hypothetical protein VNH44_07975 [Micropepsaceae bacterium]|nr:hypothetical protein [Micropepsaceae bacterium]